MPNATMDWGGGDWETGLGGASHMGRRDIAEFLLEKGARIDIFCAAIMGQLDEVKAFLTLQPRLIDAKGPHGSLCTSTPKSVSPSIKPKEPHHTFYQVFTGKGTAFDGFQGLKLDEIKDLSSKVLVVEGGEAVPWTKPQDLPYDAAKRIPKLGGAFRTGFHTLTGGYQIYFNKKGFDEPALRREIEVDRSPNP